MSDRKSDNMVCEEEQKGKGRGLKATRDFAMGEMVAIYSTQSYVLDPDCIYEQYIHQLGDPLDSQLVYQGTELGRFINDPAPAGFVAKLFACRTPQQVQRWSLAYCEFVGDTNVESANVGGILVKQACHAIKRGEWLHDFYGPNYWIDLMTCNRAASPETRLACCIYIGMASNLINEFTAEVKTDKKSTINPFACKFVYGKTMMRTPLVATHCRLAMPFVLRHPDGVYGYCTMYSNTIRYTPAEVRLLHTLWKFILGFDMSRDWREIYESAFGCAELD